MRPHLFLNLYKSIAQLAFVTRKIRPPAGSLGDLIERAFVNTLVKIITDADRVDDRLRFQSGLDGVLQFFSTRRVHAVTHTETRTRERRQLLAIEAARTWPALRVVGIDPWEPSLNLARQNLADTGMASRIELRAQRLQDIPDRDAFTLAWLAGPFLPPQIIATALATVRNALKPGGWLVFGLFASPPDPLGQALTALKVVRSGGHPWSNEDVESQMRDAGFEGIKSFTPPTLVRFTVGKRPH